MGGWGINHVKGSIEGRATKGKIREWGQKWQVQTRMVLLPEDEVGAVDLPPAAAVLEDASVAHHCALLKLGPVVGHVLGRQATALIGCSHLRTPLHLCSSWPHEAAL